MMEKINISDYIIGPVKVGNKEFITIFGIDVETNLDRFSFANYLIDGYRYPTAKELDELCKEHPFFESNEHLERGHIFVNDLGLKIFVTHYIDNWSGCLYGPMMICQELLDKENEERKTHKHWMPHIEECYDIRARKYRQWFDYRIPRHLIMVKDLK